MKHHLSILTLVGIGLLATTHVRADEKKPSPLSIPLIGTAPFSSPAVPLTREETKQLETLNLAVQKAKAEEKTANDRLNAATEGKRYMAEADWVHATLNTFAAKTALASFQSARRLPLEVRSYLPAGAISLYLGQHPMDATGEPMLLHLWTAPRGRGGTYPDNIEPSPFCLDVFTKLKANDLMPLPEGAKGKWFYSTTASFLSQQIPRANTLRVHFLDATSKQGPVVSFQSSDRDHYGPPEFNFTLIAFPDGVVEDPATGRTSPPSYVQNVYGGGRLRRYYDFGVDEHGKLTLLEKEVIGDYRANLSEGPGKVVETLKWNGREFAPPAAK